MAVCLLTVTMWVNMWLISCYMLQRCFSCFAQFLRISAVSAAVYLKKWSLLHHQPPSVLVFREETGLFQSRKDVCAGAGPLSLLFGKPPAGMWICQDDRQPPTYLSNHPPPSPPSELYHPHHPPLPVPYPDTPPPAAGTLDSSGNPGASSSPFSLF